MEDRLPRKLAAILYADVAGYSRLTGEDEDATHRRLSEYLDLISATVEGHRGRVMHYAGDAVLAMFDAVVDAVSCATEIQNKLRERNQELPNGRKVQFRIGVNSGDDIEDRGDIYGDGVNVAARLESLADPGGICISESIRTAVGKKLDLDYEFMGEQEVKNIEDPVRAYRVVMEAEEQSKVASTETPTLELPDKPSIAVLPFDNLSDDLSQEYFADGMVEEIITALSRYRWFFVIARNSTFAYKGKTVDPKQVGKELGVRYIMAGSVRRAGQRVRITAQLTDAATGNSIWAEHYDGTLEDVFDLQDRISESVAGIIEPNLLQQEGNRAQRELPENLDAYDCYLRALQHDYSVTKDDSAAGVQLLRQAIKMDPNYPVAKSLLARLCVHRVSNGWSEAREKDEAEAVQLAREAVALARDDPTVLAQAGFALGFAGELEEANALLDRSLALNPNSSRAWTFGGFVSMFSGSPETAIERFHRATRLSPLDPAAWSYFYGLGLSHLILGNDEHAIEWAEKSLRERRGYPGALRVLAAANAHLGRPEAAQIARKRLSGVTADQSISELRQFRGFQAPIYERYYNGLSKAGFPE
jgi:TolB-like protein/class 3 adenylate cyclase/Flp pilus assembly protein TadD